MGYLEILDGSGWTLRIENDKASLAPSIDTCIACNDDRLTHSGNYLVCTRCHTRQ